MSVVEALCQIPRDFWNEKKEAATVKLQVNHSSVLTPQKGHNKVLFFTPAPNFIPKFLISKA